MIDLEIYKDLTCAELIKRVGDCNKLYVIKARRTQLSATKVIGYYRNRKDAEDELYQDFDYYYDYRIETIVYDDIKNLPTGYFDDLDRVVFELKPYIEWLAQYKKEQEEFNKVMAKLGIENI